MTFLDRIDELMEIADINKNQLAQMTGIPVSTIYGWYKKGYDNITLPTLRKLANFFNCSMEYLANGESSEPKELSKAALDFARKYEALDEWGKRAVDAIMDIETRRCQQDIEALLDEAEEAETRRRKITG